MLDLEVSLELKDLVWQSDWAGEEVGFDNVDVAGLYMQEREDGSIYYFYIDTADMRVLEFWKEEEYAF